MDFTRRFRLRLERRGTIRRTLGIAFCASRIFFLTPETGRAACVLYRGGAKKVEQIKKQLFKTKCVLTRSNNMSLRLRRGALGKELHGKGGVTDVRGCRSGQHSEHCLNMSQRGRVITKKNYVSNDILRKEKRTALQAGDAIINMWDTLLSNNTRMITRRL